MEAESTSPYSELLRTYLHSFAHELNNPLAVVYGESYRLKQRGLAGTLSPADVQTSAEIFESMSKRMMVLLQDLQAAIKTNPQEKVERLNLGALVEQALRYTQGELQEAMIVTERSPFDGELSVQALRTPLMRGLWMLILRAKDRLLLQSEPRRLRMSCWSDGPQAFLTLNFLDGGDDGAPSARWSALVQLFEQSGVDLSASRSRQDRRESTYKIMFSVSPTDSTLVL